MFIGYLLVMVYALGGFDRDYSVSELKDHFEKNRGEIYELKQYFNAIVPDDHAVDIEFEDDTNLFRFGIDSLYSNGTRGSGSLDWDLPVNSAKVDSLIAPLGWTRETLKTIKNKLDDAKCIQISSGEPSIIGFKRSGMGMYSFNVFDRPIPEDSYELYNDSCRYILVNRHLVLEYGGGAVGSQCFYNFD